MKPYNVLQQGLFALGIALTRRARLDCGLSAEQLRPLAAHPLYPLRLLAETWRSRGEAPLSAGQLNLLRMLNLAMRLMAGQYLEIRRTAVDLTALRAAERLLPLEGLRPTLCGFTDLHPPEAVLEGASAEDFLQGKDSERNRLHSLVELFVLSVQTTNPAAAPMRPLFDDAELETSCTYRALLGTVDGFLQEQAAGGLLGRSLLEVLYEPIKAHPDSLSAQLGFIRVEWAAYLPETFLESLQLAFDVTAEEELGRGAVDGPDAQPLPPGFGGDHEPEAFSPDAHWMSNVVLMAKSVYVWLHQLSVRWGRPIERLDQIPDEELDALARWGFNALWLIGTWERSEASRTIKQRMGNPEAVASAYSLYDYVTSGDLGGEQALENLRSRAEARGIRLASDVVPNHTGIDSVWTRNHPEWFIQVNIPPYPAYRFTGPDLSQDPAIGLQIEDGYWNHSDAAVVFRREDRRSGQVRYIYHGNDGTHMPWNDTAQLNFLLPQVREAVIRTILQVARTYRIIRFDAAMTLAKKHFQRLWYPQPGGGAGVPSRAEHAMSREQFDQVFPLEFWREVVDRVAVEAPDTLLLAEAFWLMEGYFVRTLGMHRVYNSAFMNMLKREDNAKYRTVIKDILEFNPGILKRFVNFMNNPDEATAVEQFGKTEKYFAVAVLLCTLPGLPMFGHGQIEGLREKYGMEYRKAYWDEEPDRAFMDHHQSQIFPLLRHRYLFSEADHFQLLDFISGGHVNEDVFAYSNSGGGRRSLVVCHNRFAETGGWVRHTTAKMVPTAAGPELRRSTLGAELALQDGPDLYCRFRDLGTGLHYLRSNRELLEEGLYLHLGPYQYHVFLDFGQIRDEDGAWGELHRRLAGSPTADLDRELEKVRFAPLSQALARALEPEALSQLFAGDEAGRAKARRQLLGRLEQFFGTASSSQTLGPPVEETQRVLEKLDQLYRLLAWVRDSEILSPELRYFFREHPTDWPDALSLQCALALLAAERFDDPGIFHAVWVEEALRLALPHAAFEERLDLMGLVMEQNGWPGSKGSDWAQLLKTPPAEAFLKVNEYRGELWFDRDRMERLGLWLVIWDILADSAGWSDETDLETQAALRFDELDAVLREAARCGYRLKTFVTAEPSKADSEEQGC